MNSCDISILVQGPIIPQITKLCLEQIRKVFPSSEIVLSTWEGADVSDLTYDQVIKSIDPGSYTYKRSTGAVTENNMNRQLVSIQAGLKLVQRKYTLKLRTDLYPHHDHLLDYFDKFPKWHPNFRLFEHKIICPSVFSKLYSTINKLPVLFHPSDWWYFGLTVDLKEMFENTPIMNDPLFYDGEYIYPSKNPYPKCSCKCFPEQYYFFSALKRRYPDIKWRDWTDFNQLNMHQSKISLTNNFIFLDYDQHGITSLKHPKVMLENGGAKSKMKGLISYNTYIRLYNKYCDPQNIAIYIQHKLKSAIANLFK